jgi:phenylglyoxylate dehydrogenase epsilon subunit
MVKKHLLIGSGAAGLSALREIRSLSADDQVTMVTMEPNLPYSPTALPYLLSGRIDEAKLWTVDKAFFDEMHVTFLEGKELVSLSPDTSEAHFAGGAKEHYDTLLIATGSQPLPSSVPGFESIGVLGFHTLADYHALVALIKPESEVLLYGGGLVAMGLASNLTKRGTKVKLIVRSRVLRRYFDPMARALIQKAFTEHGVEMVTGAEIKEAFPGDRITLLLEDGRKVTGDVLVNCLGTAPRISFTEGVGIATVPDGILVDTHMMTTKEQIYAAGDVAVAKDFFHGTAGINAILPSAVEQGRVAGANMAGERRDYAGWISMNVFHFFGKGACAIGASNGEGEAVRSSDAYTKLTFQDDRLVGAQFVNVAVDPGVILYLIKEKVDVGRHRDALLTQTAETSRALMAKAERE